MFPTPTSFDCHAVMGSGSVSEAGFNCVSSALSVGQTQHKGPEPHTALPEIKTETDNLTVLNFKYLLFYQPFKTRWKQLAFFAQLTQNTTFIIPPFTVCWLLQVTSEVATKVLLRLFTMQAGGGWYNLKRGWDKAFSLISPTGLITLRLCARLPLPPCKCFVWKSN